MKFEQGFYFYFLLIVPFLWGLLWRAHKHYEGKRRRFVENGLLKEVAPSFLASRLKLKSILILLVFVASIFALARPQWGFELREVKKKGIDILIVVDTSKSMLTNDVKPNRLGRTKLAIKDLVKKLKGDRIGLLAFAGDAFLVCPLTVDYNGFLLSLNDLDTQTISRGGTNLAVAIQKAIENYDEASKDLKTIVIVTDGDNLEGDPLKAAIRARNEGIKIYTIGIGTKEGELIRTVNAKGEQVFLKNQEGNFVKSRLNEKLLSELALSTGGLFVKSSGANFGLDTIYEKELSKLEKKEFDSKMEKRYHERFQFPLSVAFLLLMIELCLPLRKEDK